MSKSTESWRVGEAEIDRGGIGSDEVSCLWSKGFRLAGLGLNSEEGEGVVRCGDGRGFCELGWRCRQFRRNEHMNRFREKELLENNASQSQPRLLK